LSEVRGYGNVGKGTLPGFPRLRSPRSSGLQTYAGLAALTAGMGSLLRNAFGTTLISEMVRLIDQPRPKEFILSELKVKKEAILKR